MDLEAHLQSPKSKEKKKKHKVKYLEASIKMVKKNPQKNLPILGYTASGFDPFLNPESNNIGLYRHQEKEKRVELVVKPKGFEVDYVGTSYSGETAIGGMGGCGLLVLNKKTQLLNFVPVTANKTFRLLPLARASQISDKEPATPTIIETAEVKRQKEYELTVLYGTKDAKKKKNKAMKLRMNQDTGDAEEVDQIIEEEKMDNAALASSSSDITHDVPPHNLSATTPEEAYLLDKIILKGEWDYVNDVLELLQSGQELKPDIYPSFVRNRFHKLELSQDEAKKRKLAGILSYITHLVNFKNWNSLDGSSSSKHRKPPPRILSQKFTKMFIDSDKNRLADDKIGSLIGYVLVLTLFVDEFETDFTDISKDLKMSTLTIRPYLENLGCRFKRQKNVTFATLPVPLTFPTIRKKRRRGNK